MEVFLIFTLFIICWWLWVERNHYKTMWENSQIKPSKEIEEKNIKSFAVEYDDKIPHPFK